MPDISVIVPSYNHSQFVGEAISSVLNQTHRPAEVIIIDDASSDASLQEIEKFRGNPSVKIIPSNENLGGAESLNRGIGHSTGELIAICNSDDIWESDKLERQLNAFTPDIGAVFTDVRWIGKFGEELKGGSPFSSVFSQQNRSRGEWLRDLIEGGNCLCHPSVLIRREVYDKVGPYDNRMRQLPDYKMWLNVLQHTEINVLADKLIRFRLHDNTSKPSYSTSIRDRNEFADIALDFFSNLSEANFIRAFGSKKAPYDTNFNLNIEKAIYLWTNSKLETRISYWIANTLVLEILSSEAGVNCWKRYGLSMRDFHNLRGLKSPWLDLGEQTFFSISELETLQRLGMETSQNFGVEAETTMTRDHRPTSASRYRIYMRACWRYPLNLKKRSRYIADRM